MLFFAAIPGRGGTCYLLDGLELEGEGLIFAVAADAEFDAISDIMPV